MRGLPAAALVPAVQTISWRAIVAGLPPATARLVEEAARLCRQAGVPAYLVGGVVRDFLLGRPLAEADVVVVGDAAALACQVAQAVGGWWVVFEAFGTARVGIPGGSLDLAPARTERYPRPGALPQVAPAGTIEEDLRRRDFTINALAVPLDGGGGGLVDPWGGRQDLERRLLRALHPASFDDDPTRLLRAARFRVRYGLAVESRTRQWMRRAVAERALDRVSAARRGQELRRALAERPCLPVARTLQRWGLLDALCPGWRLVQRAARVLARLDGDDDPPGGRGPVALVALAEGWLAGEPHVAALQCRQLDERLALTAEERQALERVAQARRAARCLRQGARLLPSTVDCCLRVLPPAALGWVAQAAGGPGSAGYRWVTWYLAEGRRIRPSLTGEDLARLGVPQGPLMGELLEALRRRVLDGRIRSRAEEEAWVRRRLARREGRPGRREGGHGASGPC